MVTVKIQGLDELIGKIETLPDTLKKEASAILEDGARVFVRNAQAIAPIDTGRLKGGISYEKIGDATYEVISAAEYSAYLEFGTIEKVSVPSELAEVAIQFKGKGLRRNGGILPHPFFFPQIPVVKEQIENDLNDILKNVK